MCRFGQHPDHTRWEYSKDETQIDLQQFTHLVTGNATVPGFTELAVEVAFQRVRPAALLQGHSPFIVKPTVYVLQRDDLAAHLTPKSNEKQQSREL